jgi:mannose-1-phosphate guanylyltransferase
VLILGAGGKIGPEQFCSVAGKSSAIEDALRRAESITTRMRIVAVVAERQRELWQKPLASLRDGNIVVQPEIRGTAVALLQPLLHILERDPNARVVILPLSHLHADPAAMVHAIRYAVGRIEAAQSTVLLMGVKPEAPNSDADFIMPGFSEGYGVSQVARLIEKPTGLHARELIANGALLNAAITVASGASLLQLFERNFADLVLRMRAVVQHDLVRLTPAAVVKILFDRLPIIDFHRDVIDGSEASVHLLAVPPFGASDAIIADGASRVAPVIQKQKLARFAGRSATSVDNESATSVASRFETAE